MVNTVKRNMGEVQRMEVNSK